MNTYKLYLEWEFSKMKVYFKFQKTGCNINIRTYVKSWNSCIQIDRSIHVSVVDTRETRVNLQLIYLKQ